MSPMVATAEKLFSAFLFDILENFWYTNYRNYKRCKNGRF